ncbi:MAG: group I intron-associated PD-(D/E)XK endonuclease [Actinomycetota bacterium]|nr:group I intron-associated PD-(D/E)XK endonuclease [Actinomycetota bacterium]
MLRHTHPRRQGDLGEAAAIDWLTRGGANVLVPLFHSADYDLVGDYGARLVRVQVKTSTFFRNGRFEVCVCTAGGNQSWNGIVKRFHPSRCDWLFVLVEGGDRWCIPAGAVDGTTSILVGGPKYAPFAVRDEDAQALAERLLEWPLFPGGAPTLESRAGL